MDLLRKHAESSRMHEIRNASSREKKYPRRHRSKCIAITGSTRLEESKNQSELHATRPTDKTTRQNQFPLARSVGTLAPLNPPAYFATPLYRLSATRSR